MRRVNIIICECNGINYEILNINHIACAATIFHISGNDFDGIDCCAWSAENCKILYCTKHLITIYEVVAICNSIFLTFNWAQVKSSILHTWMKLENSSFDSAIKCSLSSLCICSMSNLSICPVIIKRHIIVRCCSDEVTCDVGTEVWLYRNIRY